MFRKTIQAVVCSLVIAGLSACGGGGGGGDDGNAAPSAATGDLTNANYEQTARDGTTAISAGAEVAPSFAGPASAGTGKGLDTTIRGLPQLALQRLTAARSVQPAATETFSESCLHGGSMTITVQQAGDEPRKGDKVTFAANDCKHSADAPALKGRVVATILAWSEAQYSMSLAFEAFGPAGEALNGKVTYAYSNLNGAETVKFTFEGLTSNVAGVNSTFWYSLESTTQAGNESLSINGLMSVGGEYYKLQQTVAFTGSSASDEPTSGTLRLIDKQGDYVELVAGTDGYTATFYVAGNSNAAAGPITIAYE